MEAIMTTILVLVAVAAAAYYFRDTIKSWFSAE